VHPRGTERTEPKPGAIREIALHATVTGAQLAVHATAARTCSRDVLRVVEIVRSKHLRWGGSSDPRAQVFGMFIAPATIPISFAISGLTVASSKDEHEEKRERIATEQLACTTDLGSLAVRVALASGEHDVAKTDASGRAAYTIPTSEPYDGTIALRAGTATAEVAYKRPRPTFVVARDAMALCGADDAVLGLSTDAHGKISRVAIGGASDDVTACVRDQLLGRLLWEDALPYRLRHVVIPFGRAHLSPGPSDRIDVAPTCVTIDGERDQLDEAERDGARAGFGRALEAEQQLVVAGECARPITIWHERDGEELVVHALTGRRALMVRGRTRAAAYVQLASALGVDAPPPVAATTPAYKRTLTAPGDDADVAAPQPTRPAPAAGLEYARAGVAAIAGQSGFGFAAGYRHRMRRVALDVSLVGASAGPTSLFAVKGELFALSSSRAWYGGGGLSAGATSGQMGVAGGAGVEATFGYEFGGDKTRGFVQIDVTQPLYGIAGAPPSTMAMLSIGVGADLAKK